MKLRYFDSGPNITYIFHILFFTYFFHIFFLLLNYSQGHMTYFHEYHYISDQNISFQYFIPYYVLSCLSYLSMGGLSGISTPDLLQSLSCINEEQQSPGANMQAVVIDKAASFNRLHH